jgi:dTDP-4-amino-4,6-dideoxy-D-galactose acyltransferase
MMSENLDVCEILDWDTSFFGFRIARVREDTMTKDRVGQVDTWCGQHKVCCLYFLARSDDSGTTRLAEDNRFQLVDIRMTLACKIPGSADNGSQSPSTTLVRRAHPKDLNALQAIARESYHATRFYYDTNFPSYMSGLLYETWLKLSCEGYADAVFVANYEGAPAGYVSCHLDAEQRAGRIGLLGVNNKARGQGIGQKLVLSALDWFAMQGVQEVSVVTQGRNCAAQHLYQRCGFLTHTVQLWYHKWYILPEITCG